MPLRNDLLNPISPDRPAGENLYYTPIYDKIKDARREDDDAPQGEWQMERKVADWQLTIKLIGDALATKTKDLQLAVWLTEALLRREFIPGLRSGLELIHGFIENFWDGLYPELEDGDAEFRASPLRWLGERNDKVELAVRSSPLTKGGYGWIKFRESRVVGSEASADTYEKQGKRAELIAEGKITEEDFDKDFDSTPKKFYVDLDAMFTGTLDSLTKLGQLCDEKFGDVSPSFRQLNDSLTEVRQTVRILLGKKREKEPDAEVVPEPGAEPEAAAPTEEEAVEGETAAPTATKTAKKAGKQQIGIEPQDAEDAISRIVTAAKYLRKHQPYNPASYLMLRGLRWGELRASGETIDETRLEAPSSEIRQNLRRLALASKWAELLEAAETAMALECGRGWLDLQRYAVKACSELGSYYEPVRRAMVAELKALLEEYPALPQATMMDDLPAANAETLAWLKNSMGFDGVPCEEAFRPQVLPRGVDLALQSARDGRPEVSFELLTREISQEPSGRGKFRRRIQLARLSMDAGQDALALPLLQEVATEIETRKLDEWEPPEVLSYPLVLLYTCLVQSDASPDERDKVYSTICRLDPLEAIKLSR